VRAQAGLAHSPAPTSSPILLPPLVPYSAASVPYTAASELGHELGELELGHECARVIHEADAKFFHLSEPISLPFAHIDVMTTVNLRLVGRTRSGATPASQQPHTLLALLASMRIMAIHPSDAAVLPGKMLSGSRHHS